jgi:hypothetical protein
MLGWGQPGRGAGVGGWGELGRFGLAAPFFLLKLEIHFVASNKIRKIQIRNRWIRREKYFIMRSNFVQNSS